MLRANWYEPGINRTYGDLAAHYGTAILPTRVRQPRDKAKVEVGVQVVERWILARLRHRRFFSLAELNAAIAELVEDLNDRPMRGSAAAAVSCSSSSTNRRCAAAIGTVRVCRVAHRRVALDYHVEIEGHFYSVPHRLLREEVEARITARTVEMFHAASASPSMCAAAARGRHTTVPEHMPSAHRRYADWTIERIGREARPIGPDDGGLTS